MPTWQSFDAFSRDIEKVARDLERSEAQRISKRMALVAEKTAARFAVRDVGGDRLMSGWPATKLDTKIKTIKGGALLQPASPAAAAGWTTQTVGRNVGETGAALGPGSLRNGGAIRRRKDGSVAKQRGRKAKRWNGVTRGKGTADDAFDAMERELIKIAEVEVKRSLRKKFDVT